MTLKKALEKLDASLEAYRELRKDNPQDYMEAAKRQQEAAALHAEAQDEGLGLGGEDGKKFFHRFQQANQEIETLEAERLGEGPDLEEDDTFEDDDEEPEPDEDEEPSYDTSMMYSSMAEPTDDDDEEDDVEDDETV